MRPLPSAIAATETSAKELFEPNQVYTAAEVAEKLRLSRSSVLSRARRGSLPCYKLGPAGTQRTSVRFLGAELNDWLTTVHSGGHAARRTRRPSPPEDQDRMKDFLRWRDARDDAGAV